ncbi:MAG TPA: hypothetical protein VK468_08495 [Pyrinomonadaceae bacterium]|nr:hypothetical protein [Pyrinomonadaceae bacterium]
MKLISSFSAILVMLLYGSYCVGQTLNQTKLSDLQEAHVKQVIQSLDQYHPLRVSLETGSRGDGIRRQWMNGMRKVGLKEASYAINFIWNTDPRMVEIANVGLYSQYYIVNDPGKDTETFLKTVDAGLQNTLRKEALSRAKKVLPAMLADSRNLYGIGKGKICGTVYIVLLDDETLPTLNPPADLYDVDDKPMWCK